MSDVFALLQEEVDASKFDNVDKAGASDLSNLIRRSIQVDKDIEEAEQHHRCHLVMLIQHHQNSMRQQ